MTEEGPVGKWHDYRGSPIDYIFVNDVPLSISPPTITPVEYSDHHAYEATVTVNGNADPLR